MAPASLVAVLVAFGVSLLGAPHDRGVPPGVRGSAAAERAAEKDVRGRLARVQPPPGSRRVALPPAEAHMSLAEPAILTPNVASDHRFWVVPRTPAQTLLWFKRRIPHEHRLTVESEGLSGISEWGVELPPLDGLVDQRLTTFAVAPLAGGRAALRVDAEAVWQDQHEPEETIPGSANVLEVRAVRAGRLRWRRAVTDAAKVEAVGRALDRLPVAQPGAHSCPAELLPPHGPKTIALVFREESEAVAEATQRLPAGPCSAMAVKIEGKAYPPLMEAERVLRRFQLLTPSPPG